MSYHNKFLLSDSLVSSDSDDPDYFIDSSQSQSQSFSQSSQYSQYSQSSQSSQSENESSQ